MRTGSRQVTASILAAGFLGGWLSASWIAPAPVTTQVAPARPVAAAPVVDIPHVALSRVQSNYFVDYSIVLAGVLLATIPLLILFVFAGRQLVSGIMQGAVKG